MIHTHQCLTSGTTGHLSSIVGFVQRLFGVSKSQPYGKGRSQITKTKRTRSSNAEFHLKIEQVHQIIEACQSARDRVLIQILAYTGIRRAEAASLEYGDVVWAESHVVIRSGKGGKQRLVPLPKTLLKSIGDLVNAHTTGAVFQNRAGGRLSLRQINRIVAGAGKRAGIRNPNPKHSNITCHLFRHTFARLWKQQNGSMESLSYLMGHSTQATTMDLYGKESIHDMKRNYDGFIRKITKQD